MRVALLVNDLITPGGAQRQALVLARRLEALGHEATLYAYRYCPEACYPELAQSLRIRAVQQPTPEEAARRARRRNHGLLRGAKRHLYESWRLAEIVEEGCDILNPHVRGATRAAVYCKRRRGTPVVWMCEDARNWEAPGYRIYYAPALQWAFDHVMHRIELPIVREIDRIVALDHRVKNILEEAYGRPVQVVRSGVDVGAFAERPEARERVRARLGIPPNVFLLLWLGILDHHRRLEDALAALRLLPKERKDIWLLVAGSPAAAPAYVQKLQETVAREGLGEIVHFHLVDRIPDTDLADFYSAADALVYLAENQCWGLGVFEAIACNLPVIVSRACGAHEVLKDRKTAILAPPRDPEALRNAVAELADRPELCRRLARDARAEVLRQISWEQYARNMLAVFEQVLEERYGTSRAVRREAFA